MNARPWRNDLAMPAAPSTPSVSLDAPVDQYARAATALFESADVSLDGGRSFDISIQDPRAYRAFLSGSLRSGEAYMDGWWDCDAIDELATRLFARDLVRDPPTLARWLRAAAAAVLNFQSRTRAFEVAKVHYDVGNDLFERMLDPNLVYTCGYWKDATDLESAQIAKMKLVCEKLALEPKMRVLDIGCGFGAFMKYASENYGVECVGYSVSVEQLTLAKQRCAGLPVSFVLDDYRAITGKFDRVVSIGMLEAVGYRNYPTFARVMHDALVADGLALIQTVGHNESTRHGDPWIDRYVFPNGMLPSIAQIGRAIERRFVMEDWHNFGPDYDKTLLAWNDRFQRAWPELAPRYGERFKRMWELYLLSFAGGFRARAYQLWQIVLSKPGRRQPARRGL